MLELPGGFKLSDGEAARSTALHRSAIVIDGSAVIYRKTSSLPFRFDRYSVGGCTAVNSTVTDPDLGFEECLVQIAQERAFIASHPDELILALTADDIVAAKESNRGAVIFGPQDSAFIGTDLDRLPLFRDLGVRIIQLTYQRRNLVGDGCGEIAPGALSRFGISLVDAMNDAGILVDLAHVSHETSFDAIKHSRKPVALTHAHPASVTQHIRAKSDDLLKAVADSGGVVGVTCLSSFVRRGPGPRPTMADFMEHVNYLVNLIGVDHVGIGLDFDETKTEEEEYAATARQPSFAGLHQEYSWADHLVDGLAGPEEIPNITHALVATGYSDADIRKILGENFLRVFRDVWK